jgi:hypothetical protein
MEGSMPVRTKKFHPALKHAGYSTTGVLPGENAAEYEKLHREVIVEFAPDGALDKDTVASIARVLWRKQNLKTFRIAELARRRCDQIKYEKIPEDKPDFSFLMLGPHKEVDPAARAAALQAADDQARKELGETYGLVEVGEIATIESLMKDLEILDRLDATLNKLVKRFLMLRGIKSIKAT